MSNPNDPAYPTDRRISENYMDSGGYGRRREVILNKGGMTTRQRFVMAAMQGLLSAQMSDGFKWTEIATQACIAADAALAEEARTRSRT